MLLRKLLLGAVVVAVILSANGCGALVTTTTITGGPASGRINDAVLAVKDYDVVEIIFVKSEGLQVTYEALLAEAKRVGADDIINIRRDVQMTTTIAGSGAHAQTQQQTIHTATALAIKYKDAVGVGSHLSQENWVRASHETVRNTQSAQKSPWGWIAAGVGALLLIIASGG